MSASQVRALQALAAPLVAHHDADLEDVVIRQAGARRLVRLVVDHDSGLTLDLVAQISREVSRALDASSIFGPSAYLLEVTSPGVDRPLSTPRHWVRATGRLVAVSLVQGGSVTGRVRHAGEESVELEVEGVAHDLAYADVARAVVQVELKRLDQAVLEDVGPEDVGPEDVGPEDVGPEDVETESEPTGEQED